MRRTTWDEWVAWFTRKTQLDRMFGEGQWVRHNGCPATDQAYAVHHKDYHGKREQ